MSIVKEAYNLFKDIPEEEWLAGDFTDKKSKCCVIGHWIRLHSDNPKEYAFWNCSDFNPYSNNGKTNFRDHLDNLIIEKYNPLRNWENPYSSLAQINNEKTGHFQQETPKQRVIALFEELLQDEREKETSTC
jgi:hypothetical protein